MEGGEATFQCIHDLPKGVGGAVWRWSWRDQGPALPCDLHSPRSLKAGARPYFGVILQVKKNLNQIKMTSRFRKLLGVTAPMGWGGHIPLTPPSVEMGARGGLRRKGTSGRVWQVWAAGTLIEHGTPGDRGTPGLSRFLRGTGELPPPPDRRQRAAPNHHTHLADCVPKPGRGGLGRPARGPRGLRVPRARGGGQRAAPGRLGAGPVAPAGRPWGAGAGCDSRSL